MDNPSKQIDDDDPDTRIFCCHSDSPFYSKLWPMIFLFSIITDFPMPLPKGKKPGQHRDWGLLPILMVCGLAAFVYYGFTSRIVRKSLFSAYAFSSLTRNPEILIHNKKSSCYGI